MRQPLKDISDFPGTSLFLAIVVYMIIKRLSEIGRPIITNCDCEKEATK